MSTPNVNDFVVGFDPTAATSITGAQLAQLVNSATPSSDRGLILVSTDAAGLPNVPDANTTAEWKRYMWLRVSATYVTAYVWNPNGATDATYLNWVTLASAAIAPGSIQGYQIANNTIPASAIISLTSAQITGSVVAGWLAQLNLANTAYAVNGLVNNNSPMFGVMNGAGSTIATPVFGAAVIPSTAFSPQTIAGSTIAVTSPITDNSLTTRQMANSGAAASTAATTGAVDPANNLIVPTLSQKGIPVAVPVTQAAAVGDVLVIGYGAKGYTSCNRAVLNVAEPIPATDNNKVLQVNSGGTGYQLSPVLSIGQVVQYKMSSTAASYNSTTSQADSATLALAVCQGMGGLDTTMSAAPSATTNYMVVEATVAVQMPINKAQYCWVNLYSSKDAYAAPIATACLQGYNVSNGTQISSVTLRARFTTLGVAALTFKVGFATTDVTAAVANPKLATMSLIATEYNS